jgi:hypothetical protein
MLNPSPARSGKCGYFEIYPTGVSIKYINENNALTKRGGKKTNKKFTVKKQRS